VKGSDKRILLIFGAIVMLGALWFGVISPKRAHLGELSDDVATKQAEVTQQEATATTAASAKKTYESDYQQLITLGKAVPADDDVSSLIDQIQGLADQSGIDFLGLSLDESGGSAAAPAPTSSSSGATTGTTPPPSGDTASSGDTSSTGSNEAATATQTAAPATETAAADLPLGATVGAAGLPVMPYALSFRGSFFEIADFMAAIDKMVRTDAEGVQVDGRLLTVDGFDLHPDEAGTGELSVTLNVTSYVAPADQGETAGATPTTPAPDAAAPAATPPATPAPPTAAVATPTP
jgi:Tfp pilus assembly protein PilO